MTSFRVRGKIFVTVPPGGTRLHVFVNPLEVEAYVAQDPAAFEPLHWGKQVRGLRVSLAAASAASLAEIIEEAWRAQGAQERRQRLRPAAGRPRAEPGRIPRRRGGGCSWRSAGQLLAGEHHAGMRPRAAEPDHGLVALGRAGRAVGGDADREAGGIRLDHLAMADHHRDVAR